MTHERVPGFQAFNRFRAMTIKEFIQMTRTG